MNADPPDLASDAYLDGWTNALRFVRADLTNGQPCCANCVLDRAMFAGIAAALVDVDPPANISTHLAITTAERLVLNALHPDLEQVATTPGLARQLVQETPGLAAEVLTLMTLTNAKHHATTGWDQP